MKYIAFAFMLLINSLVFAEGELSITTQNITPQAVPQNAVNIPMREITFVTGDTAVQIDKLIFQRTGMSTSEDIDSIRASVPGLRSRSFSVLGNDSATISFYGGTFVIPENTTQTIIITANLNIQGSGRTISLDLVDIVSSADSVNFLESTDSDTFSETTVYQENNLEIDALAFTPSRMRLEKWQKFGRFKIENKGNSDVEISELYLKQVGTGDLEDIFHDLVFVTHDRVISFAGNVSEKIAHFRFLAGTEIEEGSNYLFEVWGKVKRNKSTYSVEFEVENDDLLVE